MLQLPLLFFFGKRKGNSLRQMMRPRIYQTNCKHLFDKKHSYKVNTQIGQCGFWAKCYYVFRNSKKKTKKHNWS
jgi:hypothetical protein